MKRWLWLLLSGLLGFHGWPQLPDKDERALVVRDLNTPRALNTFTNLAEWQRHQALVQRHIWVSCGLWPWPEKTPLQADISSAVQRDGYSVERVHFQSFPGLYVAGNLYRPLGRKGPFPGILNPHGHWAKGRLEDTGEASVAARCIQFARMGMVAFSYDMMGYQDTSQFSPRNPDGSLQDPSFYNNHVALFRNPTNQLWNLSLMGVQLWNSIRALDFLAGLPEVDSQRVGVTGASGGGTQAFLLAAVDSRIKASAPAVMVSHSMQGGCWCENAPGLRVDYSNLDFAAACAPRSQLLIGATGDWTKTLLEVEGPAIAKIYALYPRPGQFDTVRLDYGHNYNRASREAAYNWFGRNFRATRMDQETAYQKEPDADLLVFPNARPPVNALTETEFTRKWIGERQKLLAALRPTDAASFTNLFRELYTSWTRALQLDGSQNSIEPALALGRPGKGDRLEKTLLYPDLDGRLDAVVVLAHPDGRAAIGPGGKCQVLAARLVAEGYAVLAFDAFQTGPNRREEVVTRSPFTNHFNTYNRTLLQERVQDTLTACAYARKFISARQVILVGEGEAGLWALPAAVGAHALIVDANGLDTTDDQRLIAPDVFVPGVRLLGGFDAAGAVFATPKPLVVHHTAGRFQTDWLRAAYDAQGVSPRLVIESEAAAHDRIARWIAGFTGR